MPADKESAATTRDRVIGDLSRHFAEDRLEVEEFERRVERALKARTPTELQEVLAGLGPSPPAQRQAGAVEPASAAEPRPRAPAAPGDRPDRQFVVAVMGGNARKGLWTPARSIMVYAFWGGVDLDFREARLPTGVTEVVAVGIMGGVDIVVPPDVEVDVRGFALLGGIDQPGSVLRAPREETEAGRTILRIHAFALMGGIDIDVRYPGESTRDARRRRKASVREARQSRRLDRGGAEN